LNSIWLQLVSVSPSGATSSDKVEADAMPDPEQLIVVSLLAALLISVMWKVLLKLAMMLCIAIVFAGILGIASYLGPHVGGG
jgi:CHASE2 domain-containing sensor protein